MHTSFFIKAHFKKLYKEVTVARETGKRIKGFFGDKPEVIEEKELKETDEYSQCEIDGERLERDLQEILSTLDKENFEVISISPITSGQFSFAYRAQGVSSSKRMFSETEAVSGGASYGYGYGFSYTEGLMIIAKNKLSTATTTATAV